MGNGYTRQSAANIANGLVIYAADINNELNAIQSAFNGTTGHVHDGSTGNGPKISLTTSISGILPVINGGIGGISNVSATSNPTNLNDGTQGYVPGSIWVNGTGQLFWVCISNATSAAVWQQYEQYNANIAALAGLTTAANQLILATGVSTFSMIACTALAQTLLSNATTAAMQSTLGLVIGTNVQAYSAVLQGLSSYNTNGILVQTAANTFAGRVLTGTANQITVTAGDGVSGNPTISLPSAMTMTGITMTGGTHTGASFSGTWTSGGITSNSITMTGGAITGSTIDSTPIGNTTTSTGKFTTVNAAGITTTADFFTTAASGTESSLWIQTAGSNRWGIGKTNGSETGSNAGSDFTLDNYADNGTLLGHALQIMRSSGTVTINNGAFIYGGLLQSWASAAGSAYLKVPHGVAPSAPVNGDIWTTSAGGLFVQVNSVTYSMVNVEGTQTISGAKTFSSATAINNLLTVKNGTNANSTGQPAGTFATIIYNATNSSGQNGLLVKNNYAAVGSTIFEVGLDIVGGAYNSFFKIDGSNTITATGTATFSGTVNFTGSTTGLKLQKSYESAATAYAVGSAVTFAHGLGVAPKLYYVAMQCVTADNNYAVGDEIIANPGTQGSGGSNYGVTVQADATNIYARIGSNGVPALNKTTFASAVLNTTSWKIVVRAWI